MYIDRAPDLDEFKELYDMQLATAPDLFVKAKFYYVYYIKHKEDKDSLIDKWYYKILNRESMKRFNKSFFEIVPELEDLFYNWNVVYSVLYKGVTEDELQERIAEEKDWVENG